MFVDFVFLLFRFSNSIPSIGLLLVLADVRVVYVVHDLSSLESLVYLKQALVGLFALCLDVCQLNI